MSYEPALGTPIQELDTPLLLLDLDAFNRNVQTMSLFFGERSTSLRPHAKTHKCPQVALRQIEAGAIGITCAKVGEAEVLVQAGICDILVANQVVGPIKVGRLLDLAERASMMVAVDNTDNVAQLAHACQEKGVSVRVLVEVDIGMQRCGVQPGQAVLALARQVTDAPGLEFAGLMGYEGHLVMTPDPDERRKKVRQALVPLQETCELLDRAGLPVQIVSGGGTGTYDITGDGPPMTEIEAGSYVFMDTKYCELRPEFEPALSVLSTVISRPEPERIIVDAGMKTMTKEFGWPRPMDVPGVSVRSLSEEHGSLSSEEPSSVSLGLGDKVRFIPSHCCTTVNLHDALYVVQDGRLVDVWPIAARGRAR